MHIVQSNVQLYWFVWLDEVHVYVCKRLSSLYLYIAYVNMIFVYVFMCVYVCVCRKEVNVGSIEHLTKRIIGIRHWKRAFIGSLDCLLVFWAVFVLKFFFLFNLIRRKIKIFWILFRQFLFHVLASFSVFVLSSTLQFTLI